MAQKSRFLQEYATIRWQHGAPAAAAAVGEEQEAVAAAPPVDVEE